MPNNTEIQQRRRLARRSCGNCQGKPDRVVLLGGQSIALCGRCAQALEAVK